MTDSPGIFSFLEKEGLTTLEIHCRPEENRFILKAAKEWDEDIEWSRYTTDFTYEDILTDDYKAIGTAKVKAAIKKHGLTAYLQQIEKLIADSGDYGIDFYYNRPKNIRVMYCKHSNALGINNRRHAIRAGAMRRHELSEPEIDVIIDGLKIARAMAYKNAMGNIPYGGSKILVQCDAVDLKDFETMGFLAYATDRSRSFTGPDMNFDAEMADIIRAKFTKNYTDGRESGMHESGIPTGYGEAIAIEEACDFVFGSRDLSKRTVAIQGVGEVGYPLAEYLLNDGVKKLLVTDIDLRPVKKLQQKWGKEKVEFVEPDKIYTVNADVLSPCAMGGIITEQRIKDFKFKIIIGSANNQLAAISKEAEMELAKKVADAGILFVVDWAHNVGGVLCAWVEYILQEEATMEKLKPRIEKVCGPNFRKLIEEAKKTGKTPTELAYEQVEKLVYYGADFKETI